MAAPSSFECRNGYNNHLPVQAAGITERDYRNTMMENVVVFVNDKMNAILTGLLDEKLESLNEFKYL